MTIVFAPAVKVDPPQPAWVYERRILERVEVSDGGCWIWQGAMTPNGYGMINAWDRRWLTHRLAYTVMVGPIPAGLQIDHLCRERACANPAHLEPVTQAENLRRQGAAVTHCPRGHEYTSANTYITSKGGRSCRTCTRLRQRKEIAA